MRMTRKKAKGSRRIQLRYILLAQLMMIAAIPVAFVWATGNTHLLPNSVEVYRVTTVKVAEVSPRLGLWGLVGRIWTDEAMPSPHDERSCQRILARMNQPLAATEKAACNSVDKLMSMDSKTAMSKITALRATQIGADKGSKRNGSTAVSKKSGRKTVTASSTKPRSSQASSAKTRTAVTKVATKGRR